MKGGGGGVETDVCGGENSCTMYSTKRGEKRRNESMVAPTEKHGNGHRGREGNNSKTSGPRTRWNGVAHASESIFLGEGKVPTNMSGENAVPKRA